MEIPRWRLTNRWKYCLGAAALAVLGAIGVLAFQALEPTGADKVEAQTYSTRWTGQVETDDIDDEGISHASKVRYNRIGWPLRYKVTRVRYGGRHPDHGFFWHSGKWKRDYTNYWDRDSSSDNWTLVAENSDSDWKSTGTPGLAWQNNDAVAMLHGNGRVTQRLRYKERNWLFDAWWNAPGAAHFHYPN